MATFTLTYRTGGGKATLSTAPSTAQYAFLRKGGFIFGGSPTDRKLRGTYSGQGTKTLQELKVAFDALYSDTLTLTPSSTL